MRGVPPQPGPAMIREVAWTILQYGWEIAVGTGLLCSNARIEEVENPTSSSWHRFFVARNYGKGDVLRYYYRSLVYGNLTKER